MRLSRIRTVNRAALAAVCVSVVTISLVGGAAGRAEGHAQGRRSRRSTRPRRPTSRSTSSSVQIKQTKQEISDLSGDIDRQMVGYREQKDALSSAIVQQHMDAPLGPTVSLLGSGDPEEFLDGLGAVQALNSTRADQLEKFGKTAKQLKNRRDQLEDRQTSLAADKKDLAKERDKIRAKYAEAKRKLALLSARAAGRVQHQRHRHQLRHRRPAVGPRRPSPSPRPSSATRTSTAAPAPTGGTARALMQASWRAAGVSLPRVVGPQYGATRHIAMSQLQPGDLVFYGDMSHDGMYLGNGKVIHAPHPGQSVEITGLGGYSRAGRVG